VKMVWYLIGVPVSKFGDVQGKVADLEQMADIVVQSSR
jgi:hypothetical protein